MKMWRKGFSVNEKRHSLIKERRPVKKIILFLSRQIKRSFSIQFAEERIFQVINKPDCFTR